MPALATSPPSSRKVRENWNETRTKRDPLSCYPSSRSLSLPFPVLSQATKTAPPRPLTSTAAAAAPAAAPALSTDASSLSAFGLLPRELILYPSPDALSRVAGVDGEGTLWVELLLDESENENDETRDDGEETTSLSSLRSALSPTALRPGDAAIVKAPEHVRIDFEARRARRDQRLQRKRAEAAAAAAAAAVAKAEQEKQKGRVRR